MKWTWPALLATALVAACSVTDVNVPAIGDSGKQLPGKMVWHELLTDTPQQTEQFYGGLFGWEFRPLPDARLNYKLIYNQGRAIGGMIDQTRLPTDADISQWVSLLSVTDSHAATATLAGNGGAVFTPPTELGDRGTIAVVADNQGALFALLNSASGDPPDSDEIRTGDFMWDELWARDADAAAALYKTLAKFEIEATVLEGGDEPVPYKVFSSQGQPRFGIRNNPVVDMPPMWLQYLRVQDKAALDAVLAKVESLGGRILLPATKRPSLGHMAIIAGPSGAGVALQTWDGKLTDNDEGGA